MDARPLSSACVLAVLLSVAACTAAPERRNWFNDPFAQATLGLPGCPVPEEPLYTEAEMRAQAHYRAERGTSCWLAGTCPDSNAYRRDPETNARVVAAVRAAQTFDDTNVWVSTQRRFVYLQGCVRSTAQRDALSALARAQEGVELVIDDLMVGTEGKPPYTVAH